MASKTQVTVVAADYSDITKQSLEAAAAAARAANPRPARVGQGLEDGQFDGWSIREEIALPNFAMNPEHVTRRLTGLEIVQLSAIGGQRLSNMPLRATAHLLSSRHPLAGGKEGRIAIYYSDESGVRCAAPIVVTMSEWRGMWNTTGGFTEAPHWLQQLSWFAQQADQRTGRLRPLGGTVIADIRVTDVNGNPQALGLHRFFMSNPELYALIAPMDATHPASKIAEEFFGKKQLLPNNPAEFQLLAGSVALKVGVPQNTCVRTFMSLPIGVETDRVYRDALDPKLSAAERKANYLALRARIASERSDNDAAVGTPEAQSEVAAPVEDVYIDSGLA